MIGSIRKQLHKPTRAKAEKRGLLLTMRVEYCTTGREAGGSGRMKALWLRWQED